MEEADWETADGDEEMNPGAKGTDLVSCEAVSDAQ